MKQVLLIAAAALLAAAGLSSAFAPQDPLASAPVGGQRAWSTTVVLENDMPQRVFTVPDGSRFVLTDLWGFTHERNRVSPSGGDRIWMERTRRGGREVVFDALAAETPNPLRFASGVVFESGEEVWLDYTFAKDRSTDALRRFVVSGYLEEL
jgi:hypothetical protein